MGIIRTERKRKRKDNVTKTYDKKAEISMHQDIVKNNMVLNSNTVKKKKRFKYYLLVKC